MESRSDVIDYDAPSYKETM